LKAGDKAKNGIWQIGARLPPAVPIISEEGGIMEAIAGLIWGALLVLFGAVGVLVVGLLVVAVGYLIYLVLAAIAAMFSTHNEKGNE
jgi:hypothetical protein